MNWKLIFLLSLFGLGMAVGTISLIPNNIEMILWPVVILISAFLIAKNASGNYFMHGLFLGIVNCIWVTGLHIAFFHDYMATHTDMAKQMNWFHMMGTYPRREMLLTGALIGIGSGIVIGLLAWIASKIFHKNPEPGNA